MGDKVSIPNRKVRNGSTRKNWCEYQVSIPNRKVRNTSRCSLIAILKVSIPNRKVRNHRQSGLPKGGGRFQSLIGRFVTEGIG